MTNVYAWPPVRAVARDWTVIDPVNRSRSLLTGGEYVSATQRRRRVASLEVSSRFSPYAAGAGYMEALKRLLQGGVHLVRLNYRQLPRCLDIESWQRGGEYMAWFVPEGPSGWTTTTDPALEWFSGTLLTYTTGTSGGVPAITVTGLPPSQLVALPGEFVVATVSGVKHRSMVVTPAFSNPSGVAVIRLTEAVPSGERVSIGDYDTGVFAVDSFPRVSEPSGGDWSYAWSFVEAFEDEGRGPFTEVNPW